jgi:hypothetical protein
LHGILYFSKNLEETRRIYEKSPYQNSSKISSYKFPKPLYIQKKSKIYSEIILLRFRPIRPSLARAGPLHLTGHRACARPTRPEQRWRICQKAPLLRVCAVRQRCFLSLMSLPSGPRLSVPPPSSRRPTPIPSPPRLAASDHSTPPGLQHLDANQGPLLPRFDSHS